MPRKLSPLSKDVLEDETVSELFKDVVRATDSPDMAGGFVAFSEGENGTDPDAAADFLVVSRDLETKALTKYLKLKRTIGKQLSDAEQAYHEHRQRTLRLFNVVSDSVESIG